MEIDLPEVATEVKIAFEQYEKALVSNDVTALNAMFHEDTRTIRYSREPLWIRRDRGISRRALPGRFGAYSIQNRDHRICARLRRDVNAVSPLNRQGQTTNAGLGAFSGRLAHRRRSCERDS